MAKKARKIYTADCETDPFKYDRIPSPFIWGLYDGETYLQFDDTEEFLSHVYDLNIIVYAHNGGKFDWHFISKYILDFEPITIINGRIAKFKIGECEFRDSFNIIPAPLSAYKKDDFDYTILELAERHKPENKIKIEEYLKNDCVYLYDLVSAFIAEYGLNLTQAGAAMKIWAEISGEAKPNSNAMYYKDLSPYYYGGRVECFETGIIKKNFKVIDINSAYPKAMLENHPWGLTYSTYSNLPDYLDEAEIQRSFLHVRCNSFGAFPLRTESGLTFPNDGEIREFYITGWEYLSARKIAPEYEIDVLSVRAYLEHMSFNDYVNMFYKKKSEAEKSGDIIGRLFAKLFLNSLYGKFASNPENYEEFMTIPADLIDGCKEDGWNYCKMLSEKTAIVNKDLDEEKHRYYDIAVSASITGYVRANLWETMQKCKGVLYCDTDSIAAEDIGDAPISKLLGDWSIDGEFDFAAIAGKKLYAFKKAGLSENNADNYKIATKGVRLKANDIIKISSGDSVTYYPDAPTFSVKSGIKFTPRKIVMTQK